MKVTSPLNFLPFSRAADTIFEDWGTITREAVEALCAEGIPAVYLGEEELTLCLGPKRLRGQLGGQIGLFDMPGGAGDVLEDCIPIWKEAVVTHDGKKLLHALAERGLPLPRIKYDTMLAAVDVPI